MDLSQAVPVGSLRVDLVSGIFVGGCAGGEEQVGLGVAVGGVGEDSVRGALKLDHRLIVGLAADTGGRARQSIGEMRLGALGSARRVSRPVSET